MEKQFGILCLIVSALFGLGIKGENQKPTIEELHLKLASLAKLQYGNLLPHQVLDQLYTHDEVNGEEHDSNTDSMPLVSPANLLPQDLYSHAEAQLNSGEGSYEQRFKTIQNPAVLQVGPNQTPAREEEEPEPMSAISILDMEKSMMEEAGIMSLGNLEYDSENRQFEFLPHIKSILFPESEIKTEELLTTEKLRTGNEHVTSSSSSDLNTKDKENPLLEKAEGNSDAKGDITLELNPNGSDLEFIHAHSNLKTINSIPNFNAQIFTLSYGGEKRPVLIIQPAVETKKTKDMLSNQNAVKSNSSDDKNSIKSSNPTLNTQKLEETSIPNFSIHFPLETSSQFQIPTYNFTLPTLFLPGLVFTQNENTKTNTHEIHVSVPQTNSMDGFFPPPHLIDNSQVIELLSFNPRESLQNSENNTQQQNQSEEKKSEFPEPVVVQSEKSPVVNNTETEKISNTQTKNIQVQDKDKPTLKKSPPQNIQAFEKVYTRLFVTERTKNKLEMECNDKNKESSDEVGLEESEIAEEDEATLCGSDGLCGVTCARLGFHHGRCVDDDSCVCIFKQRPEFGLKIEFYVDKRARSWETIYPIHGFCHRSSCKINCEKAGYITGFCEESCFCGTPWAERTKRNETAQ